MVSLQDLSGNKVYLGPGMYKPMYQLWRLKQFTTLRRLALADCALALLLPTLPAGLEDVDLHNNELLGPSVEACGEHLWAELGVSSSLTRLDLRGCGVTRPLPAPLAVLPPGVCQLE